MSDTKTLTTRDHLYALMTNIVVAYVTKHPVQDLPGLVRSIYNELQALGQQEPPPPELIPAVPVKRSVFPDFLICLEDGKKLTMLKRHLKTVYKLTPDEYRKRWGLPSNYPMVAPNYAARRATLAREIGLGRRSAAAPEATVPERDSAGVAPANVSPRRRGRPRSTT